MCGITGFWDPKNKFSNHEKLATEMQKKIQLRGPDSYGFGLIMSRELR